MSASFRWLPGGQARSPCSIFASYWIGHERDTITHDRRQPTRLSLSLKALILVDRSSSHVCSRAHFVTAAYEGARIDDHDTRDTSSGLLVKNQDWVRFAKRRRRFSPLLLGRLAKALGLRSASRTPGPPPSFECAPMVAVNSATCGVPRLGIRHQLTQRLLVCKRTPISPASSSVN